MEGKFDFLSEKIQNIGEKNPYFESKTNIFAGKTGISGQNRDFLAKPENDWGGKSNFGDNLIDFKGMKTISAGKGDILGETRDFWGKMQEFWGQITNLGRKWSFFPQKRYFFVGENPF